MVCSVLSARFTASVPKSTLVCISSVLLNQLKTDITSFTYTRPDNYFTVTSACSVSQLPLRLLLCYIRNHRLALIRLYSPRGMPLFLLYNMTDTCEGIVNCVDGVMPCTTKRACPINTGLWSVLRHVIRANKRCKRIRANIVDSPCEQ